MVSVAGAMKKNSASQKGRTSNNFPSDALLMSYLQNQRTEEKMNTSKSRICCLCSPTNHIRCNCPQKKLESSRDGDAVSKTIIQFIN